MENEANAAFVATWTEAYGDKEPIISGAVDVWNAVHLWALAVEKAGTTDTAEVIAALESGLEFEAPNGQIRLEPGSHHLRQNIYIVEGNAERGFDVIETYPDTAPDFENQMCDLVADPTIAAHFTPENR